MLTVQLSFIKISPKYFGSAFDRRVVGGGGRAWRAASRRQWAQERCRASVVVIVTYVLTLADKRHSLPQVSATQDVNTFDFPLLFLKFHYKQISMSVAEVNLTCYNTRYIFHSVINTNFNTVFPENIYKNSQIEHNT